MESEVSTEDGGAKKAGRKRKTKAEKEAEAQALVEAADEKVVTAAGEDTIAAVVEETTARARQLQEDSKRYYLGTAIVQIHGKGSVTPTPGRYINRSIEDKHVKNLVLAMRRMGILDEENPIMLAVPPDSVDKSTLRRVNNMLPELKQIKINAPNKYIFMIAGHHRLQATASLISDSTERLLALQNEREAAERAPVGEAGHRPLDAIRKDEEAETTLRTRAHFWVSELYSLGE